MKKIIFLSLTIIWLIVIFAFSNQNGIDSHNVSSNTLSKIINVYEKTFKKDVDEEKVINKYGYFFRKFAHFTEYFILGIFVYLFLLETSLPKREIIAITFCLVCGIFDEIHQIFISSRAPRVLDIIVDTLGSSSSVGIIMFIKYLLTK